MANIKCTFCDSSWNTSKVLVECPFCGKTLLVEEEKENEQFDMFSLLSKIRDTYGIGIFEKTAQSISIMKDFAPYLEHDIRLFKLGLDADIYGSFLKIQNGESKQNDTISRIKSVLVDDYFLNDTSVKIVIEWFESLFKISNTNCKISTKEISSTIVSPVSDKNHEPKQSETLKEAKSTVTASQRYEDDSAKIKELFDSDGKLIYKGFVHNNQRVANGISFYPNGQVEYNGFWSFDQRSGYGILYDEQGNTIYQGDWLNGHMAGRGELYTDDGVYVGNFANDKKDGYGVMKYKDGHEEKQEWYLGERQPDAIFLKKLKDLYISHDESFVKQNYSTILSLANKGNSDAQFQIGKCYHYGINVAQDTSIAESWYIKSAKQRNSCALHNLGNIYEAKNLFDDAVKYFKDALKNGEILAAWNLGRVYKKRWKDTNDIDCLILADEYLQEGIALPKPNCFSSEQFFLKSKYECVAMDQKILKAISDYYNKKFRFSIGKSEEKLQKTQPYYEKEIKSVTIKASLVAEMKKKYNQDITTMEWK